MIQNAMQRSGVLKYADKEGNICYIDLVRCFKLTTLGKKDTTKIVLRETEITDEDVKKMKEYAIIFKKGETEHPKKSAKWIINTIQEHWTTGLEEVTVIFSNGRKVSYQL